MTDYNIFGDEIKVPAKHGKHHVTRRGYAWKPGTGPDGEKCKGCSFAERHRKWAKCGHSSAPRHTGGKGTDILLNSPACKFWKKSQ